MEITVEKVDTGVQKLGFQALSTLKTVRVAVYARVSTDQEIQLHSLEEQMKAFRAKIAQHPGWMLVDVYADEGISGTSVKKRKEFLRMMEDCEAGKVDYIMAKSISRFARNTVECLSYVRHLQSIGVQLYFEKEGLDTATSVSELILTVMAAFAQEESRSISENLKWGIRKRFESGESRWTKTYGYRKTKDGEIVIEPDEAAIVRMIFKMYQYGIPMTDILDELTFIQAPSARGKQTWNKTALKYLLENEKYIGDMRLQKWVSVDHISHRSVRNDSTVIPVYNVRNHHVPIIDRHTYQQVQRIMELKSPHGEYSRYPYFDTNIVCPLCGKKMIPRVMKVNSHKRILGCFDVDGCRGYAVKGYLVDAALLEAYNTLEIKEKKRTVAMQRMLEIKAESPKLDTVQYYWLDDLVGHIEFKQDTMRVFWKCGLESEVALNASKVEEPTHVAELYRNSLDRAQRSENKPVSVVRADKKSVNTREAQRNAAMQTAKNLRAKENGVAADALRWCIAKPDKRKSRKMSCRLFSELLYKEMDWSGDCRYKILGYRIEFEGEALYVFDLVAAEVFHECKKKQSADQQPTTVAEENTEEQPVNPRKGYYPDDIAGTFGMPVEQHRQESELRQMDGFVSVGMLTGMPGQQQNL